MARYDPSSPAESCNRAQLKSEKGKTGMLRSFSDNDFRPVGFGLARFDCGSLQGCYVCHGCRTPIYGRCWCNRRECPVCHVHWAGQGARRISGRLASRGAIEAFYGLRLLRGVLSPGIGLRPWSAVDFLALRRSAVKEIKRCGVLGGVLVFHAYRTTDKLKSFAGSEGLKYWDAVRALQKQGLGFDELVNGGYIYFSPHFHWVGFARHTKQGSRGAWVFKVFAGEPLNKSKGRFIERAEVVVRSRGHVSYLLSHCSSFYDSGKTIQSYSWFGRRFVGSSERYTLSCPRCGSVDLIKWGDMLSSLINGNGFDCPADKVHALSLAVVEGVMPDNPCVLDGDV